MKLKEIRYNFIEHKATIIVPDAVEAAADIADSVNRYFIGGEVDCEGYSHLPESDATRFYFWVNGARYLDLLVSVFESYLNRYAAI